MVKIYLRYGLKKTIGVIASAPANVVFDPTGKCALTGALEQVVMWNIRRGTEVSTFVPSLESKKKQPLVSRLCMSPDKRTLAVGYVDGSIRLWDLESRTVKSTFRGHKGEVTALCFDKSGQTLASGGADTDLVIWDVISEAGKFRLRGHKNAITDLKFVHSHGLALVSSSKDFLLKIWDLETQHCIQTIVGHRAEVWSFDINAEETRLLTASDDQIRVYKLGAPERTVPGQKKDGDDMDVDGDDANKATDADADSALTEEIERRAIFMGALERKSKERPSLLRFRTDGGAVALQSSGKTIEFLKVYNQEEIRQKRRKRKRKEKQKRKGDAPAAAEPAAEVELPSDEFAHKQVLRTQHKIQSFAFSSDVKSKAVLVSLQNNSIELYKIRLEQKTSKPGESAEEGGDDNAQEEQQKGEEEKRSEKVSTIELPGHRADIRALAISSNDEMILSASNNMIKLWNTRTFNCIRTIKTGYGLCAAFAPGDRHVILGTKTGGLELYDLQASRELETIENAHKGAVWGIQMRPDKRGIVTCSADKTVKFWDFELIPDTESGTGDQTRLSLSLKKVEDMPDDVLAVKYSADGKFLACSLLDTTVRIYFADTMKFFLSLYGHKLPVMTLDISDDSALIITGSADKNIKIWGLDFGDCHRSLYAHTDSVMSVAFVPGTHYFFSAGKDGAVKYWDADKFEQIMMLEGHQSEIWALAVSSEGQFVVTGSHDRSLRVWERSDEQLVLEEERENEMEEAWEAELEKEGRYAIEDKSESAKATTKSLESIRAGERLLDALQLVLVENQNADLYDQELKKWQEMHAGEEQPDTSSKPAAPKPNIILQGRSPSDHLLFILKSIKAADLEEAILILPLNDVLRLLRYLDTWVRAGRQIELCSRVLFYLVRLHQAQISSNRAGRDTLQSLRTNIRQQLKKVKDTIGFNMAAMGFLRRQLDLSSDALFFEVREKLAQQKDQKQKKRPRQYWEDDPK